MTPPTATLGTDAAATLVQHLPSIGTLTPSVTADGAAAVAAAGAGNAAVVTASFVGATAADIALALVDTETLAASGGDAAVSVADVLRPALEAVVSLLGTGVLGDVIEGDAALFTDPDATVFALHDAAGAIAGWFALRVRETGVVGGPRRGGDEVLGRLGRISDVEMALTVELGRTRMSVRDVLALEPGAVIELDRSAGAPADILLNGRLIAHGEIVVVDQDYAVRITSIIDVDSVA